MLGPTIAVGDINAVSAAIAVLGPLCLRPSVNVSAAERMCLLQKKN